MDTMITGSRKIINKDYVKAILDTHIITKLLQGDAIGVDSIARDYIASKDIKVETYKADWDKHGKSAGFIRNDEMVRDCIACVAIWDGISNGTKHAIKQALKNKRILSVHLAINTLILYSDNVNLYKDKEVLTDQDILDLFKLEHDSNKYEIIKSLNDSYDPLEPSKLLSLDNKALIIKNKNLREALSTFLVTKLLLMVESNDKIFIPLYHNTYEYAIDNKSSKLLAFIINNRLDRTNFIDIPSMINPTVETMDILTVKHERMDTAIRVLQSVVSLPVEDYEIVLLTDSDADGTDSCALGYRYFENIGSTVHGFVNERRYGNGVNDYLTDKATIQYYKTGKDKKKVLYITADHGSSIGDDERYARLKELGDNVLIITTDHHLQTKGDNGEQLELKNVDAFVNPQDKKSTLPPYISGCVVLYSLFLNHDIKYKGSNYLSLDFLMPYNAITTVTDMMDLSKPVNRYMYKQGLEYIKNSDYAVWKLFRDLNGSNIYLAESISMKLGPNINACNRMGEAYKAFELLVESNEDECNRKFDIIESINIKRRNLQKKIMDNIPEDCDSKYSVVIEIDKSSLKPEELKHASGVIGIVANQLSDRYGKPCFVFSKEGDYLKCSGRGGIKNIHLTVAGKYISDRWVSRGGIGTVSVNGHSAAAGGGIRGTEVNQIPLFRKLFDEAVYEQTNGVLITSNPIDLTFQLEHINIGLIKELEAISPFGKGFSQLSMVTSGMVSKYRKINNTMMSLTLMSEETGYRLNCISFNTRGFPDIKAMVNVEVVGELNLDSYTGSPMLFISELKIIKK